MDTQAGRTTVGLAAVAATLVVSLSGCGGSSSQATDPAGASTGGSASPSSTVSPVSGTDVDAAAAAATADGLAVLVPDHLPKTWSVTAASYDPTGHAYQFSVTLPQGTATVREDGRSSADLLGDYDADATQGAPVDLKAWQLGTWDSWTSGSSSAAAAISTDLPIGGVLVTGDSLTSVSTLTKTLLTYEDGVGGDPDD